MKRNLLLAALCVVGALGYQANAQKDVTNDYLKNADFSESTPIDNHILGYGKDKNEENNNTDYYSLIDVTGWSKMVVAADNSNSNYPNSGMAGGVFAYGSDWQLRGNKVGAPAKKPNDNATNNCLGYFGVWGCGGYYYQEVVLPAGKYNMTVPTYSQSGTQASTSYTGFIADNGTQYVGAVNIPTGSWQDIKIEFTLSEETKGRIALGYKSTGNGSNVNPHLFFDCVKLTYTISYEIYSSIVDAAKALRDKPMNKDVKSVLDAAISQYGSLTASDEAQFEIAVEALGAATSAANTSIKNYETALAILNAANSLDKDGRAAYAADEVVAAIQAAYEAGTLETVSVEQEAAAEQAFQAAIRAQGAGADMTLAINNWDFLNCQNGNFPGWTIQVNPSDAAKKKNETQVEFWTTGATRSFDYYQTVTNLPVGKYTIQASMWYSIDKQTNDKVDGSAGVYGASSGNEVFKGVTDESENTNPVQETTDEISVYDGTLRIGVKNKGTMGARWFGVDWIKLTYVEPIELAAEAEYAALNAAIAAAEEHTLGFEAGEYAPYNNVEVVALLASAKALNQEADNAKEYVEALTQALNDAKWSEANTEEVNAFYDGTLKESVENTVSGVEVVTPAGWTPTDNIRRILKNTEEYPGLIDATDKSAIFAWSGGVSYGEQVGYEMVLKKAVYKLQVKVAGWNNETRGNIIVSVKNGENGMIDRNLGKADRDIIGKADNVPAGFTQFETIFTTGEAGNYVFSISSANNIVITDLDLRRVADVSVIVDKSGYATFSSEYALNLSAIEGGKAYIATDEAKEETIKLTEQTGVVAAGTGLVIVAEVEGDEPVTVTIPIVVEEGEDLSEINYLKATDGSEVEAGNYVLVAPDEDSEASFYRLDQAETLQAGKAYLSADAVSATNLADVLRIVFDDDDIATAIEGIVDTETDGVLYNVAGLQVGKDYKGIVIDKNGKKYLNK